MSLSSWYTREIEPDVAPIISVPSEAAWHLTPRRFKQEAEAPQRRRNTGKDALAVNDTFGFSDEGGETEGADTSSIISLIEGLGHEVSEATA